MSTIPPVGQISGMISSGPSLVLGGHVVAVDANGTPMVSTLSQPDGSYVLQFLPPAAYRVYVEPLDGPVSPQNVGGWYRNAKTDFGTTYFGGVSTFADAQTITVTAGSTVTANIQALPQSSTGLNLTRPSFAPRLQRGISGTLSLGGDDISAGVSFGVSTSGVVLGPPTFDRSTSATSSASMPLSVSTATPLGPKILSVSRNGSTSLVTGTFVVVDPSPRTIFLAPRTGPIEGGTNVTVTGSNFRPGARVFFGGLAGTNIQFVDSGTILATTPPNSPNAVNVAVINDDGTWGIANQGFTYFSQAPTITRITPSSGPPGTPVTIEGDHFDTHPQNLDVRFNDAPARVLSSTLTTINTVVPFSTSTGPVSVSLFGQRTTGPVFTVTSAAVSNNIAGGSYNFIDASGGTALGFSNRDDSVAYVTLPFDFTLFTDTFLAGSRISIATNGYISLDGDGTAEFQNARIPAVSVRRSDGSTGSVPTALIAAFWDDLLLKGDNNVTVSTLGSAPNRKFVVQWSNMSILDEVGTDLNASLTFEIILFEGSNDIQFQYQNLSGARSDGSSATVGIQDLRRTSAILTGFNQAILRNGLFYSYHFQNGIYSTAIIDTTPPTKPVVTDGGATTQSRTELSASWTADDPESGIRDFQYAIGKTPGATDVRPFTTTTQNSVIVTGLSLDAGATYYFAVKATNNAGLTGDVGVSDGIRVDPAFQPEIKVIPAAPQSSAEFSGVALYAPAAMSVVLKAIDANGTLIAGSGVRNPTTVTLAAGQQYARMVSEIFGIQTFDGWIEAEASAPGLGISTVTGATDVSRLDGATVRPLSADFVLLHPGASAILVNNSTRTASVTVGTQAPITIAPRSRGVITVPGIVRVQSSEPLAALERISSSGKLALSAAAPVAEAQTSLVFAHAVAGGGYTSTLSIANVTGTGQDVTVTFGGSSASFRLEGNASARIPIGQFLQLPAGSMISNAVRVAVQQGPFLGSSPSLVGGLDIENQNALTTIGARAAATDLVFPHVANGNGLFTGLAFATGSRTATIRIDVYEAAGGTPKTATITLDANQQRARLISELIPSITTQLGGYIKIHSDQPIWAWEIYGSDQAMASGPPL